MAKFSGKIGYVIPVEQSAGVYVDRAKERPAKGDVLQNVHKWENGEWLNNNLNVDHRISILADSFFLQNGSILRYVKWRGAYWCITSIDYQHPRIILNLGGVYNGPKADEASRNACECC